jgi:Cof subfamily protein (haloacid dehalogenase superfamily)
MRGDFVIEIRLVAIDLDGTLLDDHKDLSSRNRLALEKLLKQGVVIALASARDCASIHLKIPIALPGLYYIGNGGALIYDAVLKEVSWASYLTPKMVTACVTFLRQFNHPVFLNTLDSYWVDRYNDRVKMIEERYNLLTSPFADDREITTPIMRVSLAAPVQILEQAASQAAEIFAGDVQVSLASPDWLDLLPINAGKGQVLKVLQDQLQISPDQTMAIGDYESDLPLFEQALVRVAMGNAVPAVKAASTFITRTNNEDGVAKVLERI